MTQQTTYKKQEVAVHIKLLEQLFILTSSPLKMKSVELLKQYNGRPYGTYKATLIVV